MITVGSGPLALDAEGLSLFYSQEALLGNLPFLVLYGPSSKTNSTQNGSRIQAHVYSLGGFQSFSRLTIAPTSPLYVAVHHLPHDVQGDEVCRGLAVSILSYFSALSSATKGYLREVADICNPDGAAPAMFDEMHAAQLASNMVQIPESEAVVKYLTSSLAARTLSWLDVDVLLPPGSMSRDTVIEGDSLVDANGLPVVHLGCYNAIIEALGPSVFMPTTKLQRAPSKPMMHNKSKNMSKDAKISLRREMCEFVDTENNYLGKIRNLAQSLSPHLRQVIDYETWRTLFPETLGDIMGLTEMFYHEIRSILDTTEADAIRDIENDTDGLDLMLDDVTQGRINDMTGIVPFARVVVRSFPGFATSYQEYMHAGGKFSFVLAQLSRSDSPKVLARLNEIGEQQLRSALIEPVQRLPRYTMFIDNMLQLLPIAHIARPSLLKARDAIANICALDDSDGGNDGHSLVTILRDIVSCWPAGLNALGRLITAVDAIELPPPYSTSRTSGVQAILLLFPGKLVVLRKLREASISARGLQAELGKSTLSGRDLTGAGIADGSLSFEVLCHLKDCWISESSDGTLVHLMDNALASTTPRKPLEICPRAYYLQSPYQGKASRFVEDVVKSKIEGRHSVELRESHKWSLRCMGTHARDVGLLAAVTEVKPRQSLQDQYNYGFVRLILDDKQAANSLMAANGGAFIVGHYQVSHAGDGVLHVESLFSDRSRDPCSPESVPQTFRARVQQILGSKAFQSSQHQISFDAKVLERLPLDYTQNGSGQKGSRSRSPVKLLSTIFGSVSSQAIISLKPRSRAATLEEAPQNPMLLTSTLSAPEGQGPFNDYPAKQVKGVVDDRGISKTSLNLLEDTLASYLVALRCRSGNVVGKILQARSAADELAVNELYNTLLEDADRLEAAAVVSVDILFAAFEKFLRVAWRERMGPLLAPSVLNDVQANFDRGDPKYFRQQFKQSMEESSPQNRRAFAAILKLLCELLDASGNDADRGVLIASFTEALVLTGNPHDYIMLFDRLVDDHDILFDDIAQAGGSTSNANSLNGNRSFNTDSMSSNASSFRRKLGLGGNLARNNSKSEAESKVASIWRTLSKNARSPGDVNQSTNASKVSLVRSKSTDTDVRTLVTSRPVSRDRPPTSGSMSSSGSKSRPGSSYVKSGGLVSIGENSTMAKGPVLRKKRRSSLSDLQALRQADNSEAVTPLKLYQPKNIEGQQVGDPPANVRSSRLSPQRSGIPRFTSPEYQENPPRPQRSPTKQTIQRSEPVTIMSYAPSRANKLVSHLPPSRTGLTERPWPPNSANIQPPSKDSKPAPKLRIQSPQKLRQRLSQEQRSTPTTDAGLQAEMDKIGGELSAMRLLASPGNLPTKRAPQKDLQELQSRLDGLQKRLTEHVSQPATVKGTGRLDVEAKLLVAEKKVTKLDELYTEANAENEALYDRFNDELGKILARAKKGEGVDELRSRLGEAQGDLGRLKAENAKLKREIVGLRSLVPGD